MSQAECKCDTPEACAVMGCAISMRAAGYSPTSKPTANELCNCPAYKGPHRPDRWCPDAPSSNKSVEMVDRLRRLSNNSLFGVVTVHCDELRALIALADRAADEPKAFELPPRWKAALQGHCGHDELWEVFREAIEHIQRSAPPPSASPWQPIETAPHPSVGESFLVAVQPMGDPARPYHVGEAQRFDGVWYWAGNDPCDSWGGPIAPSHWMPMPRGPETKSEPPPFPHFDLMPVSIRQSDETTAIQTCATHGHLFNHPDGGKCSRCWVPKP